MKLFKELLTLEELLDLSEPGEIIGRMFVFVIGLGLAMYALTQGFPWYVALIVAGGFYVMAMEKKVSDAGEDE